MTAPVVSVAPWVPTPDALTPEGVARHVRILSGDDAPDGWRRAGVAVWSGSVGEYVLTWRGCGSATIGHGGLVAAEDATARHSLILSGWRDIGSGVHVAITFERDWTCAP